MVPVLKKKKNQSQQDSLNTQTNIKKRCATQSGGRFRAKLIFHSADPSSSLTPKSFSRLPEEDCSFKEIL